MAKLHNTKVFTFRDNVGRGSLVKVGNNRTAQSIWDEEREGRQRRFVMGFLHGHSIFAAMQVWYRSGDFLEADPHAVQITLNTCGHRTVTTRNAMKDFMRAMGILGSVSFAKGEFTVRYLGAGHQWHEERAKGSTISFTAVRLEGAA